MIPRTTKVTLTASAVTLACLGATLYASPQVIAETLGREVHAFSPLDPTTYPGNTTEQESAQAMDATATARPHSTLTTEGTWTESPAQTAEAPERVEPPATLDTAGSATPKATGQPSMEPSPRATSEVSKIEASLPDASAEPPETHDDDAAETADLDSPDSLTVIVNKLRPLPEEFVPADLVELPAAFGSGTHTLQQEAAEAAENLFAAAHQDGIDLTVISAYRSFEYQQELYDNYVAQHGTEMTNEMSAMPGHSEHQTGLALDVDTPGGQDTLRQSFGDTDAGQWLVDHAHEFGFVIRYPQDAEDVTGFHYEPWHLRYFGEQYAQEIVDGSGVAETEFGIEPAPDYDQ